MSVDAASVVAALRACLSAESQKSAEQQVRQLASLSGFATCITQILCSNEVDDSCRQLAGIVLKQFVNEQWSAVGQEEKVAVKVQLPPALAHTSTKIRMSVAAAIAAVADKDLSSDWPDLLPWLVQSLKCIDQPHLLHGCTRCIGMIISKVDDRLVPQLAPILFPELLNIVSQGSVACRIKSQAISVVTKCLEIFLFRSEDSPKEMETVVHPFVPTLVSMYQQILSSASADVAVKIEVVKALNM